MPSEVSTVAGDQSLEALRRELAEVREQQAATAEILASISSSVTDANQVFAKIAASAARLCDAHDATIFQVEGDDLRIVANHGPIPPGGTLHLTRAIVTGCAVLDRRTIHVGDLHAESNKYPEGSDRAHLLGHRTILAVPLIHAGEAIGAIAIRRTEVRPFTDRQIELLKTFADQAIIAIENTRLFEEVQARTRELQESLKYQTAIGDVLGVISRSPSEVQPVLEMIAKTARRLCEADRAIILRLEIDRFLPVARDGIKPGPFETLTDERPGPADHTTVAGRAVSENRAIHIEDYQAEPQLTHLKGAPDDPRRTALGVPLSRDGAAIGAMVLTRTVVRPFTQQQIDLVTTFADQAVIAIENARLFQAEQASKRELTESLEQQTATADVLKVISRSALDVQRVLDALVESAARLCNAYDAAILQVFGDGLRLVAHHGPIPWSGPVGQLTIPLVRGRIAARAVIDRRTIHVADALAEADVYPVSHKNALQQGYRTALAVPLVHTGEAIGVILVRRAEVHPFTERQIELVNTFADQAVIAIENSRLLNELRESLQQQTATADVLKVISR